MRLLLLLSVFFLSSLLAVTGSTHNHNNTKVPVAMLQKMDGLIKILPNNSIKKLKAKAQTAIYAGDMVLTYQKSHAVLELTDGSYVVLDERSSIRFYVNALEQKSGRVLYDIQKRSAKNALKVKTDFAIIGIKGTTFIVDAQAHAPSIALKEGIVEIRSIREDFELHRKQVFAEFEAYKKRENQEFQAYKEQYKKSVSHVKSFELKQGKVVSFQGKIADENDFNAKSNADFEYFKKVQQSLH